MSYATNFGVVRDATPAGFGARLVAALIDLAILWGVTTAGLAAFAALCAQDGLLAPDGDAGFGLVLRPLAGLLYFAAFEGGTGATPGKLMMQLQVRTADGRPAGLAVALGRNLAKLASVLTLGIGFMLPMWTSRGQALHDLLAGSVVMRSAH